MTALTCRMDSRSSWVDIDLDDQNVVKVTEQVITSGKDYEEGFDSDPESEKNEPVDIQEFGTNISDLTSPKQIALLEVIKKQVNSRHHPLNIIA